jgi:hypothetical protein
VGQRPLRAGGLIGVVHTTAEQQHGKDLTTLAALGCSFKSLDCGPELIANLRGTPYVLLPLAAFAAWLNSHSSGIRKNSPAENEQPSLNNASGHAAGSAKTSENLPADFVLNG